MRRGSDHRRSRARRRRPGRGRVAARAKATGLTDDRTSTVYVPTGGRRAARATSPSRERARSSATASPETDLRGQLDGVVTVFADYDDGDARRVPGLGLRRLGQRLHPHERPRVTIGRSGKATEASKIYVAFKDGDRVEAEIVGWDGYDDVALLRVDPEAHALEPVPLGDSSRVRAGDPVAAMGSPFGNEDSIAVGVVSAIRRSIDSLTSRLPRRGRDPDRRADHARELGRPALRRQGPRDRDQRPDPERERQRGGRRLRDPDQRRQALDGPAGRDRAGRLRLPRRDDRDPRRPSRGTRATQRAAGRSSARSGTRAPPTRPASRAASGRPSTA